MATTSSENGGGGVYLSASELIVNGSCGFEHNSVSTSDSSGSSIIGGGAIMASNVSHVSLNGHCGLIRNTGPNGGGVLVDESSLVVSGNVLFLGNGAESGDGGAILVLGPRSRLMLAGEGKFQGNVAIGSGGGVSVESTESAEINGALFLHNEAQRASGGAIHLLSCPNATVTNCNFTANIAGSSGGAMHAENSTLSLRTSGFLYNNKAGSGGGLSALQSTVMFSDTHRFEGNVALAYGGGAVQLTLSSMLVSGNTSFSKNTGFTGGGVHIDRSEIEIRGLTSFQNNTALYQGGAIFVSQQSVATFAGCDTVLGGNSAQEGGALAMENGGRMVFESPLALNVVDNVAHSHGGGILHTDYITASKCSRVEPPLTLAPSCFFELRGSLEDIGVNFSRNSASIAGSVLYGGGLDHCRIVYHNDTTITDGIDDVTGDIYLEDPLFTLKSISTITPIENDTTSSISSAPLEICFCNVSGVHGCSQTELEVSAYPGELISIPLVTLGQDGGTSPAAVHISSSNGFSDIDRTQRTGKGCANLAYRVRSTRASELLTVHPEGGCGYVGSAHRDVRVHLLPCPPGFNLSNTSHDCICEDRLTSHNTICDIDKLEVTSNKSLWLHASYDENETYLGLLLSTQCPPTHCAPPPVRVSLTDPDGQCLSNRSGVLCGGCAKGYSLTLSSQRCLECSNEYISLLAPFALAGILLVVSLFLLNLTVAEGTINGLVLYANLVQFSEVTLLPSGRANILTVFIAWLNLDLGIEACFYDGMDAYTYNWLQYSFPLYLGGIMGTMYAASCCSKRLTKYLGSQLTAVTATLVLFNLNKLLRASAMALSVSEISTNLSVELVWRQDGNLGYFNDYRHIILGTVSLLVLLGCFLFSLLLFTWNVICSNRIKSSKLSKFVECYSGPFMPSKISWVGFLASVRFFLAICTIPFVNTALNALITLLAVSLILLMYSVLRGKLYKKTCHLVLECSFLVNLLMFLATSLYIQATNSPNRQEVVTNFFLGLAFVKFFIIVLCRVYASFIRGTVLGMRIEKTLRRGTDHEGAEIRKEAMMEGNLENSQFETSFTIIAEPLLNS